MEVNYQLTEVGNVLLLVGHVYLINDKLYLCVDCEYAYRYHYDLVELETGKGIYLNSLGLEDVNNTSQSNLSDEVNANFDIVDVTNGVKVVAK